MNPVWVAGDAAGNVHVADALTETVCVFDPTGNQIRTIQNDAASAPVPAFDLPNDVAVDGTGNLYVTDEGSSAVFGFDPSASSSGSIASATPRTPRCASRTPWKSTQRAPSSSPTR